MSLISRQTTHVEHDKHYEGQQPAFTNGSAKFVMTNDGTKDCLALLVTEMFLKKLNEMFEHDRNLENLRIPLNRAKTDIESVENSIQIAKSSLESAKSEAEKEDIRQYLAHQEPRLRKFNHRKDNLEEQRADHRTEISRCSIYAHYVLETAMDSARLLKTSQLPSLPENDSNESVQSPEPPPAISQTPARPAPSPEQLEREVAYDELEDCWHHLDKLQRLFGEREYAYQEELAEHRRRCPGETCSFIQSEFDRRHVAYGMQLTGALIEAESSFERAKDRAKALEVFGRESESDFDHRRDDSTSAGHAQVSMSMPKRKFIEAWRADISDIGTLTDHEELSPEDADAGLVEISDSMSARDCGEYRKRIDRWQEARGVHEGSNRKEMRNIWVTDDFAPNRRHSD